MIVNMLSLTLQCLFTTFLLQLSPGVVTLITIYLVIKMSNVAWLRVYNNLSLHFVSEMIVELCYSLRGMVGSAFNFACGSFLLLMRSGY